MSPLDLVGIQPSGQTNREPASTSMEDSLTRQTTYRKDWRKARLEKKQRGQDGKYDGRAALPDTAAMHEARIQKLVEMKKKMMLHNAAFQSDGPPFTVNLSGNQGSRSSTPVNF